MDNILRPMSTSQVLDRTFSLYRNHFVLFVGIAIVAPALRLVSTAGQLYVMGPQLVLGATPPSPAQLENLLGRMMISYVVTITVGIIGYAIASGATVHAVSMVHLSRPTTIAESYSSIKSLLGRIFGITFLFYGVALGPLVVAYTLFFGFFFVMFSRISAGGRPDAGAAFLLLGGVLVFLAAIAGGFAWLIYAIARFALAIPACVVEKISPVQSMKRSTYLSQGSRWRIILILLLMTLITGAFTLVLEMPAFVASGFPAPGMRMAMISVVWIAVAEFVGGALAGPILTIATALVYYDQRVRKEAFDLQLMMDALGQPSPEASVAAAPPAIG